MSEWSWNKELVVEPVNEELDQELYPNCSIPRYYISATTTLHILYDSRLSTASAVVSTTDGQAGGVTALDHHNAWLAILV
jgi:hypothetical protein